MRIALATCALALLAAGTACGERTEPTGAGVPIYPVTVQGAAEHPTALAETPRRIVPLGPGPHRILRALGLERRTVTVDDSLVGLPLVAQIKKARPDLIVASSDVDPLDLARARSATNAAVYVTPDSSLGDVERAIGDVGLLTGRPVAARRVTAGIQRDRRQVTERFERHPRGPDLHRRRRLQHDRLPQPAREHRRGRERQGRRRAEPGAGTVPAQAPGLARPAGLRGPLERRHDAGPTAREPLDEEARGGALRSLRNRAQPPRPAGTGRGEGAARRRADPPPGRVPLSLAAPVKASASNRKLAAWLALTGVLALFAYIGRASGGKPPRDALYQYGFAVSGLVEELLILGIALWIARGIPWGELGVRQPRSWGRALGLALVLFIGILIAENALESVLHATREQGLEPAHWQPDKALAYAANAAVIVLVAPIAEEFTYRGLGIALLRRFGAVAAVIVSAVAFAAAHGLIQGFPALFIFGAALAVLRLRTESVLPGMLFHACFNGIALAVAFVR